MGHLGRWYVPGAHGDRPRRRRRRTPREAPSRSCSARCRPLESADPEPWTPEPHPRVRIHQKESDSFHIRVGGDGLPLLHPDRYVGLRARRRARRRHVVAPLHRGARAPRARLLHLRAARPVRRGRVALLAGRRRPQARRRGRDDDRRPSCAHRRRAACPTTSSTKARNMLKGRLVLGLEDPRSIVTFGLRGDDPRGRSRARSPRCSPGSTRSRAEDVARVAQELLAPEQAAHRRDRPVRRRGALRGPARRSSRALRRASAGRPRRPGERARQAVQDRCARRGSRSPRPASRSRAR